MEREGFFFAARALAQKMLRACNASKRCDMFWKRLPVDVQNLVDYFSDKTQHHSTLL